MQTDLEKSEALNYHTTVTIQSKVSFVHNGAWSVPLE